MKPPKPEPIVCERCGRTGHHAEAHEQPAEAAATWARIACVQASAPATISTTVEHDRELDLWSAQTGLLLKRCAT